MCLKLILSHIDKIKQLIGGIMIDRALVKHHASDAILFNIEHFESYIGYLQYKDKCMIIPITIDEFKKQLCDYNDDCGLLKFNNLEELKKSDMFLHQNKSDQYYIDTMFARSSIYDIFIDKGTILIHK